MKMSKRSLMTAIAFGMFIGCAPVKFSKNGTVDVCQNSSRDCKPIAGLDTFEYTTDVSGGQVDILFVDDNSGSMSFEQNAMANRFSTFIQNLDSNNIDYHIGIITTDVSTSSNSPFKNGNLVTFSDGSSFLTKNSAGGGTTQKTTLFQNAIKRSETLTCETYLTANPNTVEGSASYVANCPSGDERGIYAANQFLNGSSATTFIRPKAHLALVFLADEDNRSQKYDRVNAYALESNDLPQTLINNVQSKFAGKTLSVHSIIVSPGLLSGETLASVNSKLGELVTYYPSDLNHRMSTMFSGGNSSCLQQQSTQLAGFSGSYGYLYAILTRMTGGIEGDICAADYSSQLSNISVAITERLSEISLECSNPQNLIVTFTNNQNIGYRVEGRLLKFDQDVPAGTRVTLSYGCTPL